MAQFNVVDMNGKKVSTVELSDAVFGITPNEKAVHIAVVNFLANQRQGTQNTKIRMEVSGGGKKPWRQKGTGHARQGSTRAPQWTHGGVALGPKPRDYSYHINKKVKRLAVLSALSDKALNGDMIVVDKLTCEDYKTKTVVAMLNAIGAGKKNLVVNDTVDAKFIKSAAKAVTDMLNTASSISTRDVIALNDFFIISTPLVRYVQTAVWIDRKAPSCLNGSFRNALDGLGHHINGLMAAVSVIILFCQRHTVGQVGFRRFARLHRQLIVVIAFVFYPVGAAGEGRKRCRTADMLTCIIRAVRYQLNADKSINIAGVLHIHVGLYNRAAVELLLHFAGHLGGSECVRDGRAFCAEPCNGAADGQRKKENGRHYYGRHTASPKRFFACRGCRLLAVLVFIFAFIHFHSLLP